MSGTYIQAPSLSVSLTTIQVEDVYLLILEYLSVRDILGLRRCCKKLNRVTRIKQVWVWILQRDILQDPGSEFPLSRDCFRPISELNSGQVEALVLHICRIKELGRPLSLHPETTDSLTVLSPSVVRLDQIRSVTWLKLIRSKWLLCATSDATESSLALWSLDAIFRDAGTAKPVAEAFLSAPVIDGAIDIQDDTPVIAVTLRSTKEPAVEVLSLRAQQDNIAFVRLAYIPNLSHVRVLRGQWIGCALRNDRNIPCLLNWSTGVAIDFYSDPQVHAGCIAMSLSEKHAVLVFRDRIYVYSRRLTDQDGFPNLVWSHSLGPDFIVHRADISPNYNIPTFREGCADSSTDFQLDDDECSGCSFSIVLSAMKPYYGQVKIYTYRLQEGQTAQNLGVSRRTLELTLLWEHSSGRYFGNSDEPLIGTSGHSVAWIDSLSSVKGPSDYPGLLISRLYARGASLESGGDLERSRNTVSLDSSDLPALHHMGSRDYDELGGIIVIGNAFGELAICNISKSPNVNDLGSCLKAIRIPDLESETLAAQCVVPTYPAPPYPLMGPHRPHASIRQAWKRKQPEPRVQDLEMPDPSWIKTWDADDLTTYWGSFPDAGWIAEHSNHFYGSMIPLIQWHPGSVFVFNIGGLNVALGADDHAYDLIDPDLSLHDFLRGEDGGDGMANSPIHLLPALRYQTVSESYAREGINHWKLRERVKSAVQLRRKTLPDNS